MANIKSAIKRVKTNETARAKNMTQKSAVRTNVKKVEAAIALNDAKAANETIVAAVKGLDKAATKGLISKNAAARKKSRLMKKVNKINA